MPKYTNPNVSWKTYKLMLELVQLGYLFESELHLFPNKSKQSG